MEKPHQSLVFNVIYNTDYQHIAITPCSTSTITSPLRQTHYAMGKEFAFANAIAKEELLSRCGGRKEG
jgi:hypothetical protein